MKKKRKLHEKYRGIITPVLMPFHQNKSLDFPTLEKFVDWLCTQKVSILFPMGGSGEYQFLSTDERVQIMKTILGVVNKRTLVFFGTGAENLQTTIKLTLEAEKLGADGVGVVMPTDIPDTEEELFSYYHAVGKATKLPFMVYDPRSVGHHFATPKLIRRLIDELDNLVAIKYRATDGELMGKMCREIAADVSLFSGSEAVALGDLALGAVGCVGGGGNFYPNLMWSLQDHFERGDILAAREVQFKILEAIEVLDHVYWPLSGKIILQELGFPFELVTRVPARPYTEEGVQAIRRYYRKLLL